MVVIKLRLRVIVVVMVVVTPKVRRLLHRLGWTIILLLLRVRAIIGSLLLRLSVATWMLVLVDRLNATT